jgi:RimJ/RimL family protein N-acetyltransferase
VVPDQEDIDLDPEVMQAPILSRRLLLRAPTIADLPALTRLINDPSVARNTSRIPHPYPAAEGWRFLRASTSASAPRRFASFLITHRGNPRLIVGGAGIDWGPDRRPELGYWIARDYRRRGFASEAAQALLHRVFAGVAVEEVEAWTRVGNIASQRVLLRAGFRRIGVGSRYSRMLRRHVRVIRFVLARADFGHAAPV